jgi:hypothetical protein
MDGDTAMNTVRITNNDGNYGTIGVGEDDAVGEAVSVLTAQPFQVPLLILSVHTNFALLCPSIYSSCLNQRTNPVLNRKTIKTIEKYSESLQIVTSMKTKGNRKIN